MLDVPDVVVEASRARPPRRRRIGTAAVAVAAVAALGAGVLVWQLSSNPTGTPKPSPVPSASAAPSVSPAPSLAGLPKTIFGFYSAGLAESDCFGSCRPSDTGYKQEQADLARMAELQAMHVNFVTNNQTIVGWYNKHPKAFLAYLDALHQHGIQVSYSIAGPNQWFKAKQFDPSDAERLFARTDLNHDGVSDLDGRLDVLYQGHEVLEYATHAERVQIYQVAKKWFPHTPVSVYYAGFERPFLSEWKHRPHPGSGLPWSMYAYGPGEADIVHIGVPRSSVPGSVDRAKDRKGGFNPATFHAEVAGLVKLVHQFTPNTPVVISTSFAGDDQMRNSANAMWSPQEISDWYHAAAGVPGVRGVLLRSFGRFEFDLANPAFSAQRAAWVSLGAAAAKQH